MLPIDQDSYDTLVAHARAEYPNEACALLAGNGRIEKVYTLPNAEASPTFYVVEPRAQLAAMNEMDERGWELLGIFHSHTFTEAYPSRTDISYAAEPQAHYVLVSTAESGREPGPVSVRSYRILDGVVTEEEIDVTDAGPPPSQREEIRVSWAKPSQS